MTVLEVEGLEVRFPTVTGSAPAVDQVSFTLRRGETLGLVGESGSGKTMTGYAVLRLTPPPGRITAGRVRLLGQDLLDLPEPAMRRLRGDRIALIMQDPMACLNDVIRIGTQMTEVIHAHRSVGRAEARAIARDAMGRVGIPRPEERLDAYPHEFSGGMRQRIAIAIALLNRPDVIIADEPTTALDVTIQAQILSQMQRICAEDGTALLWITHDLSVGGGLRRCDRRHVCRAHRGDGARGRGDRQSVASLCRRADGLRPPPATTRASAWRRLAAPCPASPACLPAAASAPAAPAPIPRAKPRRHWPSCCPVTRRAAFTRCCHASAHAGTRAAPGGPRPLAPFCRPGTQSVPPGCAAPRGRSFMPSRTCI